MTNHVIQGRSCYDPRIETVSEFEARRSTPIAPEARRVPIQSVSTEREQAGTLLAVAFILLVLAIPALSALFAWAIYA